MAERKKKDTTDENVLSTSTEGEIQGNEDSAPGTDMSSEGDDHSNEDPAPDKQPDKENTVLYEITCRNKISKMIGGVMFVEGVGRTGDGYAASWFGNKEGYEVTKIK